jgi:hypothetical protein
MKSRIRRGSTADRLRQPNQGGPKGRHEAERLAGKPAPRFAASTDFEIVLEPAGDGTSTVSLRSTQEPASALRGAVIRLFGRREVAQHLRRSLAKLAEVAQARAS